MYIAISLNREQNYKFKYGVQERRMRCVYQIMQLIYSYLMKTSVTLP